MSFHTLTFAARRIQNHSKLLSKCNNHLRSFNLPIASNFQISSFSTTPSPTTPPKQTSVDASTAVPKKENTGGIFGWDSNFATESFNTRWLMAIPAVFTHMCIGSPYAWSLMADVITRDHGFVAAAASDWSLGQAAIPLSVVFVFQGLGATLVGKWQIKVGPRKSMAAASLCFGGGMMLGAAGIYLHSLPLLYFGYGVLGGTGIGLAYTPPLQALMEWFPDKKGIASGLVIAGFGSAALVFTPIIQALMKFYTVLPTYLGPTNSVTTQLIDGKFFSEVNGKVVEVINAGTVELSKLHYHLADGWYIVGSGSTGAAEALATIGAAYFSVIMASALVIKRPHPSYKPPVPAISASASSSSAATTPAKPPAVIADVSVEDATKAPQFHLLGITFFCLATGGMGMMSVAKPMMSEVFSTILPAVVTSAFATKFVLTLAAGNLGGRLGWAAVSDAIGRRNTFLIFTSGAVPLYLAMPTIVEAVVSTGTVLPLYVFCASAALAVSAMGGVYALLPAYEADLFGTKYVGAIHGRMLLYSSIAAIAGPSILIYLRSMSNQAAIENLITKINPAQFEATFGASIDKVSELIAAKTLTINKLLVLCPPGTIDPTPHLYDTTMYAMGVLMTVGVLSHFLVKPLAQTSAPVNIPGTVTSIKDVGTNNNVTSPAAIASATVASSKSEPSSTETKK